jgi:hypothetical protein
LTTKNRTPRKYHPYRKFFPAADLLACFTSDMNDRTIAEAIGTSRKRVHDFHKPNYHITWLEADRYAIRMGLHPLYIWGDLWLEEVSPLKKQERPPIG